MKIISGTAKGRSLACVPGDKVRPTPDRMRQAMFNILGPEIDSCRVLDLFSGTGSLGLEALSRGADHCHFVEVGYGPLQILRRNIRTLGFEEQATVLARSVFDVEIHLEQIDKRFDLVFAAPPYAMLEHRSTSVELFNLFDRLLQFYGSDRVTLNLQHSPQSHISNDISTLERFDHRQYGYAELSRFRYLKGKNSEHEIQSS